MSGRAEPSTYLQDSDPELSASDTMSVALIGPNEAHRRVVAKALASSDARSVREFAAYPSTLNDLPRLLQENFNVIMIDLDSDQEVALQLVEKIASISDVTVMVYSAKDDPDLLARCIRAGARDFLPLPQEEPPSPNDAASAANPTRPASQAKPAAQASHPAPTIAPTLAPTLVETPAPRPTELHIAPEAPRLVPLAPPEELHSAPEAPAPLAAPARFEDGPRHTELHIAPPRHPAPPAEIAEPAPHFAELHIAPAPSEPAPMPDIFLAPEPHLTEPHQPEQHQAEPAAHPAEQHHTLDDLYVPAGRKPRTTVPLPSGRFIASDQPEVSPDPSVPQSPTPESPAPDSTILEPAASAYQFTTPAQPSPAEQHHEAHHREESAHSALAEPSTPLPEPVPAPQDDFSKWDDIHLRGAQPVKPIKPSPRPAGKSRSAKKEIARAVEEVTEPAPKPTRAEKEEQRAMFREIAAEDGIRSPRDKMTWLLIGAVPIAVAVLLTLVFMRPAHHNAPAPAPTQYVAPPAAPSAAPDAAATTTPATTPAASQPTPVLAKPSPSTPGTQVDTPSQQPRGKAVSPDAMDAQLNAPSRISPEVKRPAPNEEAPTAFTAVSMEGGAAAPVLGSSGRVKVVPPAARVSAGVAQGLLIRKVDPAYPQIAKTSRVSGTVVMGAVITRSGSLADLHVISGPAMLRAPALDAVRQWRYRPYMLNNQPVEVETTVSVVFNLGN